MANCLMLLHILVNDSVFSHDLALSWNLPPSGGGLCTIPSVLQQFIHVSLGPGHYVLCIMLSPAKQWLAAWPSHRLSNWCDQPQPWIISDILSTAWSHYTSVLSPWQSWSCHPWNGPVTVKMVIMVRHITTFVQRWVFCEQSMAELWYWTKAC